MGRVSASDDSAAFRQSRLGKAYKALRNKIERMIDDVSIYGKACEDDELHSVVTAFHRELQRVNCGDEIARRAGIVETQSKAGTEYADALDELWSIGLSDVVPFFYSKSKRRDQTPRSELSNTSEIRCHRNRIIELLQTRSWSAKQRRALDRWEQELILIHDAAREAHTDGCEWLQYILKSAESDSRFLHQFSEPTLQLMKDAAKDVATATWERAKHDTPQTERGNETLTCVDGPFGKSGFRWKSLKRTGLSATPFRLLKFLWNAADRTATFDDLAEFVWDDKARDGHSLRNDSRLGSARRTINEFLDAGPFPFKVETSPKNEVASLSELTAQPITSPKRGTPKKSTPKKARKSPRLARR